MAGPKSVHPNMVAAARVAYSYFRFSTPEQAEGDSERRQTKLRDKYCKEKGLTLDESLTIRDCGVSAFRGKNKTKGALSVFLKACENGQVPKGSTLIVEDVDRLSRQDPFDGLELIKTILKDFGITLVTLTDKQEYTSQSLSENSSQWFILLGKMIRAHEESATKSMRVSEAWDEKRKKATEENVRTTKKCPGWIRWSETLNDFELHPQHLHIAHRAVQMAIDGIGPVLIAATFNREGVPTWGRTKTWEYSTFQYMFRSRTLIGEYQPKRLEGGKFVPAGEPIANYYPALIDEAEFYRLQAGMDVRKKNIRGRTGKGVANIFGRRLTSGLDGGTLTLSQKHKDRINLVSMNTIRGLSKTDAFPYAPFEWHFLNWVKEIDLADKPVDDGKEQVVAGKLVVLRAKLDRLYKGMDDADAVTFERLMSFAKELGRQEADLIKELEAAKRKRHRSKIDTSDIGEMVYELRKMPAEQRHPIRAKLKASIASVVDSIRLWVAGTTTRRVGVCIVKLRDGSLRDFTVVAERYKDPVSWSTGITYVADGDFDGQPWADELAACKDWEEMRRISYLAQSRAFMRGDRVIQ